jgi:endoglucanase
VKPFSGAIHYVEISCSTGVAPGGQSRYRKEIQFRITSSGTWDPANDWSRTGLAPSGSAPVISNRLNLVEGTGTIWGTPPQ